MRFVYFDIDHIIYHILKLAGANNVMVHCNDIMQAFHSTKSRLHNRKCSGLMMAVYREYFS